jgi:hypothetical protein
MSVSHGLWSFQHVTKDFQQVKLLQRLGEPHPGAYLNRGKLTRFDQTAAAAFGMAPATGEWRPPLHSSCSAPSPPAYINPAGHFEGRQHYLIVSLLELVVSS